MNLGDIPLNVPVILAGAFCAAAWSGVLVGFRRSAEVKRAAERMRFAADFYEWAAWTYVSVVDKEGRLFHRSLVGLRDHMADCPDIVWGQPKATIIYEAGPEDPDPYGYHQETHHGRSE